MCVFMRGNTGLIRLEARHNNTIAALGTDIIGIRSRAQSVLFVILLGTESNYAHRRAAIQRKSGPLEKSAELLKPLQRASSRLLSRLRIHPKMRAGCYRPICGSFRTGQAAEK
jgi:hypothetical protein